MPNDKIALVLFRSYTILMYQDLKVNYSIPPSSVLEK